MPRNGSGVYSLPAGNPVVSGTTISSGGWGNPTMADLANEITNSLDRSGRGGMTAALQLFDGVMGNPGLTFTNEPTSGWYRISAGNVGFSVLGSLVGQLNNNGLAMYSDAYGFVEQLKTTAGLGGLKVNDQAGNRHIELIYAGSAAATTYGITAGNSGVNFNAGTFTWAFGDAGKHLFDTTGAVFGALSRTGIGAGSDIVAVNGNIGVMKQLNMFDATASEIVNRAAGGMNLWVNAGATKAVAITAGGQTTIIIGSFVGATATGYWGQASSFISSGGTTNFGFRSEGAGFEWGFSGGGAVMKLLGSDLLVRGVAQSVSKAATTSRNTTTTLAADPDLGLALAVGRYEIEANLWWSCAVSGNANGLKFALAFSGTNGASDSRYAVSADITLAGNLTTVLTTQVTCASISSSPTPSAYVKLSGEIVVSAPGTLSFQWAQNSSGAQNLNLFAGSSLKCTLVS